LGVPSVSSRVGLGRAALMTSLRHHGGDKWSVRGYVGHDPLTGKPRRRSISFRANGVRAAEKAARRLGQRLDEEREGLAAAGSVAELVADWLALAERDRSPSTLRKSYRPRSRLIVARFGTVQAPELRARDIDAWYTALMSGKQPKSAASIHELHRVFSAILQFGVDKDRLLRAVTRQVTLPEHHRPDIQPPTDERMQAIFARLPDVPWGRAVQLLAATGMRRGEVVGLRWDDWNGHVIKVRHSIVELPGGGLAVKEPKGKRTRDVTLGSVGCAILERQQVYKSGPWVFGDTYPARPGWISTHWSRWRAANGASGVRLHDLRHWYATHALESGASVASVAAQLGHAQVSTTSNIYHARTDAGRQQVAAAIDAGLGLAP
jgi:integrase